VRTESQGSAAINVNHVVRHRFAGQSGQGFDGGNFHGGIDTGGAHVQRAAENEGKPEDIVDLVGLVATSGGEDEIVACGMGQSRVDFRIGVGEGKYDRVGGHAA